MASEESKVTLPTHHQQLPMQFVVAAANSLIKSPMMNGSKITVHLIKQAFYSKHQVA